MPANLTPQYHEAEAAYKSAKTVDEKIITLQNMLTVIPKHKGTEKIQADLKKRLASLKTKKQQKKQKNAYTPFTVEKQGAGQVVLVGFPNSGKSALVSALTKAKVKVAEFPFTTTVPATGMMNFEDVSIQLVDTPPVTTENIPPGFVGTMREGDLLLIVIDASTDESFEQLEGVFSLLEEKNLLPSKEQETDVAPPFLIIANKADLKGSEENLEILHELYPDLEILPVSATGYNLEKMRRQIFNMLNIIRIYSKPPGRPPQLDKPFTIKKGATVLDFAACIHKDFSEKLKNTRVWGSARFDGQSVSKSYLLKDKDVVEINI